MFAAFDSFETVLLAESFLDVLFLKLYFFFFRFASVWLNVT